MIRQQNDLAKVTLGVIVITGLCAASLWVLLPFMMAVIWATMVVVTTWPIMLRLQARLWGRRSLATLVMTLGMILVLVIPLLLAIATIVGNSERIVDWVKQLGELRLHPLPAWISGLPLIGDRLQDFWQKVATSGVHDYVSKLAPFAKESISWVIAQMSNLGMVFVQLLMTVGIAGIMYMGGESAAAWIQRFGERLGGPQGGNAVVLAGRAIRGVALGVVVTALAQSILGGIGLAISGVPMAAVLTAIMFMLCIAQLGPILVLAPAVVWLYWSGDHTWGTVLLVWTVIVGTMDNFLRPVLIKKGADLPMLLIFAGVMGGLITFGLVGIFVGPVILAVTYTLVDAWVGPDLRSGASSLSDP